MATAAIGLSKIEMGPVAGDGGMGATLTQIGATVSDTAAITTEEGTTNGFTIEEIESDFYSSTIPGQKTMAWSTYDVDLPTLQRLFGGTITAPSAGVHGGIWEMPDQDIELVQSVKVTQKSGHVIEIPHMKINARLQWNLKKTALSQVDIVGTILAPTKAGVRRMRVLAPAA